MQMELDGRARACWGAGGAAPRRRAQRERTLKEEGEEIVCVALYYAQYQ